LQKTILTYHLIKGSMDKENQKINNTIIIDLKFKKISFIAILRSIL
jgi:hypothetical protein